MIKLAADQIGGIRHNLGLRRRARTAATTHPRREALDHDIVPMNAKGVTRAKKIKKIGMMASDTGLIHSDEVRSARAAAPLHLPGRR